ncbi:MAG: hypothetical protein LCI00_07535 [Chloroflexi bacterium]|nr:hypothetical protein [Chloroflexota bacterium]MCC6894624.1 hypothetical protein [Anaerolineae bacterium]
MDGSSFYDDNEIFNTYMQRRQRAESPNDTLEKPVMMAWVGDVRGKRIRQRIPLFLMMSLRKGLIKPPP